MPTFDCISINGYVKALETLPDKYRSILEGQFLSPQHAVSPDQLARLMGYKKFSTANFLYGRAAHLVCNALNISKPPHGQWWAALSQGSHNGKAFLWIMRPNLVESIKQIGWPPNSFTRGRKVLEIKTYLLTWNPRRCPWDNLAGASAQTLAGKGVIGSWSCGNTKSILPGDRIFLMRVTAEPKGIIGSGWVTTKPHLRLHWDSDRAAYGEKCLGIDGEWERLINPAVDAPLGIRELQKGKLASLNWTPQSSGTRIPDDIAAELEEKWAAHVGKTTLATVTVDPELAAMEGAERMSLVRHRKREQSLRDAKIAEAKKIGSGKLECEVTGCGFDFEASYGELGRDYAQVHHLKPLGDRTTPSQTKLSDLAIVCANCHAMIHRGGKCRPLDNLIQTK